MFNRKPKPDIFERLEQEATDELRLLDELGPEHFGTDHLMELHAKVCEQIGLQKRFIKIALSVGAAGVGWALLGMFSFLLDFQVLTLITFGLAAIGLTGFLGLQIYSTSRFQTRGHLDHTRHCIEDELRRRRDKHREHTDGW